MPFAIPNTLSLPAEARAGGLVTSLDDLLHHLKKARAMELSFRAVGSGSNIIPAQHVDQYVGVMRNRGVQIVAESRTEATLEVAAGEIWHDLVCLCGTQGWFGLENLALIPGTVGAAPIQNIGAYGVELADFIDSVFVADLHGDTWRLGHTDCEFGYRDSALKSQQGWVVVSIRLRLPKTFNPVISYPDLQREFTERAPQTSQELIKAVVAIRSRKLPDPVQVPNVGSFFKNPIVTRAHALELERMIDNLVTYPDPKGIKLSGAQLIEHAGFKGRSHGQVACWPEQALVLVNRGNASTAEVLAFAATIQGDIEDRYGVQLELEPSLLS